jgi:hypothetical protein
VGPQRRADRTLPAPSDAKADSSLRAWTVRVDDAARALYMGIRKPQHYLTICMNRSEVFANGRPSEQRLPYSGWGQAAGSLFHFTADLSAGTLRVRPVVKYPAVRRDSNQTEWIVTEEISDLAGYIVVVAFNAEWGGAAFTLLNGSGKCAE